MTDLSDVRARTRAAGSTGNLALALPVADRDAPPTGTVTFLLSDVVDSTPQWDAEPEAMAQAVSRHYAILDQVVRAHGGVRPIEQGEGDSMVAAFAGASEAVAAAIAAQRALLAEEWPTSRPISVRMALHSGEARIRDELYYAGPSIIRCARLRGLAHGGQILASACTAGLLGETPAPGVTLRPLGVHALKGLRTPEEVFCLEHTDLPGEFPPPPSSRPDTPSLPVPVTSFVGRLTELVELIDLASSARCVSIVGAGGCGKTRLALETATALVDSFADGVWWVELAEVVDHAAVPAAVLAALAVEPKAMPPLDRLLDYLKTRDLLLVLDNCEHLTDAAAAVTTAVLEACPNVRVLATSREPLRVRGERAWRVGPLALPGEFIGSPERHVLDASAAESVQLFCDRATAARHTFRLDESNVAVVADLCRRLDGIPLALELAAARVGSLSPERILAGLEDRFRLLADTTRGMPDRHATLTASLQWSHDLLSEQERVLFRRLASFFGPFGLESVEEVAADESLDRWDVMTALAALVDKSLVAFDGERYWLLQTMQEFAAKRLADAGETEQVRDRHLVHHRALAAAAAAELTRTTAVAPLMAMEESRANLMAAMDWALERGDAESAATIAGDLTLFWQLHGRHAESLACLRRSLAALPEEPSALRARLLGAIGMLGIYAMDLEGGYGFAETTGAIEMATAVDDPQALGRALGIAGFMTTFAAPSAALETLASARSASLAADDPYGAGIASAYGAFAAVFGCARADLATPHLAALTEHAKTTGSPLWAGWQKFSSGMAAWQAGRLSAAVADLTEADDLIWALGDPTLESWCSVFLSDALIDAGDYAEAERVIRRSSGWMERSSYGRLEYIQTRWPALELARGDLDAADTALAPGEALFPTLGFDFVTLHLASQRARWAAFVGDLERAGSALELGATLAEKIGMPWYVAEHCIAAGQVQRASGADVEAEESFHRALALCVTHGFAGVAADALEGLASLAVVGSSWAEAARLYGAASALREATGQVRWAPAEAQVAADLAAIAEALGAEPMAAAFADGVELDLGTAASYAARARGERKRPAMGWEALTPTELAVVELAAQGLTNAEIGKRLFMTAGTAKVHLHHVFGKLGVSRRAELAALATERRLTAPTT